MRAGYFLYFPVAPLLSILGVPLRGTYIYIPWMNQVFFHNQSISNHIPKAFDRLSSTRFRKYFFFSSLYWRFFLKLPSIENKNNKSFNVLVQIYTKVMFFFHEYNAFSIWCHIILQKWPHMSVASKSSSITCSSLPLMTIRIYQYIFKVGLTSVDMGYKFVIFGSKSCIIFVCGIFHVILHRFW